MHMCQTNSLPSEQIAYISGLCVKKSFVSLDTYSFYHGCKPKNGIFNSKDKHWQQNVYSVSNTSWHACLLNKVVKDIYSEIKNLRGMM